MNEQEKLLQVQIIPDHLLQIIKSVHNLQNSNKKLKHLLVPQLHLISYKNHHRNLLQYVQFSQIVDRIKAKNQLLITILMIKVNSIFFVFSFQFKIFGSFFQKIKFVIVLQFIHQMMMMENLILFEIVEYFYVLIIKLKKQI
jgi:hypothetical protein